MLMLFIALAGLWLVRKKRLESARWFQRFAILGIFLPILANWSGWIFTEMGRQPWVVYGLLKTSDARSPNVSMLDIILSLAGYLVVYSILVAVGARLFVREMHHGPDDPAPPRAPGEPQDLRADLILAY